MNKSTMFLCLFLFSIVTSSQANHSRRRIYIVYMGVVSSNGNYLAIKRHHYSLLRSVTGKRLAIPYRGVGPELGYTPDLIVSNYGKTFDGFAAWLTEEESKKLSAMPGVISIFPSLKLKLLNDVDVIKDEVIDSGLRTQQLAPL